MPGDARPVDARSAGFMTPDTKAVQRGCAMPYVALWRDVWTGGSRWARSSSSFTDALKEAGASDEKARAAAQALANDDSPFSKIAADLLVLMWMAAFMLAGVASLVVRIFVA